MGTEYQTWLGVQTNCLNELEKEFKKNRNRVIITVLIGCIVALFVLTYFVCGFAIALQNAFFGLILGLLISLFCLVVFSAKAPRKCYLKSLKNEIACEFPEECQSEQFAREMLEASANKSLHQITWDRSGGKHGRVEITKEYAILFWENKVTVVKLWQVKRIERGAQVFTVRNEYGIVCNNQENFPIRFFYYHAESASGTAKERVTNKWFNFPSSEIRERVVRCIESYI